MTIKMTSFLQEILTKENISLVLGVCGAYKILQLMDKAVENNYGIEANYKTGAITLKKDLTSEISAVNKDELLEIEVENLCLSR